MNHQATLDNLQQLKLTGMAEAYSNMLQLPVHQHTNGHELLATLAEAETLHRQNKKSQQYLTLSKLRFDAVIQEIHCTPERNITADQLSVVASFNFMRIPQNIIITGATGSGKSYLACAIGRLACHLGHKTLYLNMNRFIEKIATSKLDGTYIKMLNQIERIPLLILDDFGLQPLDQTQRLALLQILEDRYAKKPTIVASQLPVSRWHEYLADPTIADAILDRLTANANRFDLKGKSMRQDQLK
jgi:DNA replication protein DnaC